MTQIFIKNLPNGQKEYIVIVDTTDELEGLREAAKALAREVLRHETRIDRGYNREF